MATAGDIVVNLTANSQRFNAGLKQGQDALRQFQSTISTVKTAIAGFLSFEAIKGGIGALSEAVKNIDRLGDEASKIGVPVDFLSELQHAAKMTDVSVEGLTGGLRKMETTLGAAGFTGNPAEAFLDIADAIKNTEDQFQQADLAKKIFGRGGVELLPLLRQGRSGIMDLGAEARRLGVSFDEGVAKKADDADNAFKRMDASMQGLKSTIGISLAPAFTDILAPAFVDATLKIRDFITSSEGIKDIQDTWRTFAETIATVVDALGLAIAGMKEFFNVGQAAKAAGGKQGGFWNLLGIAQGDIGEIKKFFGNFNEELAKQQNVIPKLFGDKIRDALLGIFNRPAGAPGAPKPPPAPFALPPGAPEVFPRAPNRFLGNADVFSNEGFSVFARAISAPTINIQQQQLAEQKKGNQKLQGIIDAINNAPKPVVGDDL